MRMDRPPVFLRLLLGVGGLKILLAVLFLFTLHPVELLAVADKGTTDARPSPPLLSDKRDDAPAITTSKAAEILLTRIRRLKEREADLDQREKNLEMLKSEIETKIKELKRLQAALESTVGQARAQENARFQHLVGVYSAMQPQRAATLLDKMEDKTVVKIFSLMKSRKVAAILALMDPDKAARISAALTKRSAQ